MNEFENFFNLSTDPMTIADANGKIIHANSVYTAITGWSVDELKATSYWDLLHPDDHPKARAALQTVKAGHPVFALEYRFLCKDGTYKTFIANLSGNKKSEHLYAISRLKEGQIVPYIMVANAAPVAVIIINTSGTIIHVNDLATTLFGYEAGELQEKSIEDLIPMRLRKKHQAHRGDYQSNPVNRPMGSHYNLKGLQKNGLEIRVDIALNPLYEQNELYVACSILDITEKITTAELALNLERENLRLARLAQRDPLTQAYNRRTMEEMFPKIAEECKKQNRSVSAIMLDLDNFKTFNDSYGHQTGDQLLKELAYIAQNHIRENDILVRYGGEEFFIIMPNCTPHQASEVAERIRSSLEKDMTSGHKITASLGISTYGFSNGPEEPLDEILEKLIEQSDQALYQAKDKGKNRVQHFSSI
ncbi:MAG TPA: diguanylate cyclase [Anaerolineales bacterium]|nr:diguanylate cyclase [Anaerolineales bacterium]